MTLYAFGRNLVSLGVYEGAGAQLTFQAVPDGTATRIEHALGTVLQRLPEQSNARVLILTDGVETHGNAAVLAQAAAGRRVPVDVFPLIPRHENEVLVEGLIVPEFVAVGEPYDVRAVISSTVATEAEASLYRDGALVTRRSMELEVGRNLISIDGLQETRPGGDTITYELRLAHGRTVSCKTT